MVREGADELTVRADEEGTLRTFIDTTNVGNKRWGPPFVDEDWQAIWQPFFKGSREQNGGPCIPNEKELHQAVQL